MFTLSIILNLHREGELTVKTIQNLRDIIQEPNDWKKVEVIAILDNPDDITLSEVDSNSNLFSIVEIVDYRDLGDSRNHGVSLAKNEFIVFADGDDYCSLNMLQALYSKFYEHYSGYAHASLSELKDEEHVAVFPEYLIEFPDLFQMQYCDSNDYIVQNNRFLHCYHSKIAIYKYILYKYKINRNESLYGYEDWDLNNRLLANRVQYSVAKYKLYYRRHNLHDTLLLNQVKQKNIVRNSNLYALDQGQGQRVEPLESTCMNTSFSLNTLKSNILNRAYKEVLFLDDKVFLEGYSESYAHREDIIQSSTSDLSQKLSEQSVIYNKLMKFFKSLEIIYFVPWIELGGADKVILEYIKSIENKYNAGLITTLKPGTRIDKLNIPHLDLPSISEQWEHISQEDKMHIIVKALINSDIKIMHIINSDIALQTIKYYQTVYEEHNKKTIVSLFCPDYDWLNNVYHGYPVMYPELFKSADIILSDNNYWYDFFKELNQNKNFKYKKIASTTKLRELSYHPKREISKKILWASRICNQKLFGVFEDIVNQLPEYEFVIYGGTPEEPDNIAILERLLSKPNIEFRGEYQDIEELDLNEFDLYLFTSLFEGIPTIILDMAMSGIPIVTANVGGISEVLGSDYSLLVEDVRESPSYIDKIIYFYQHKKEIIVKMKNIREYIIGEYNDVAFQKEYRNIMEKLLNDNR